MKFQASRSELAEAATWVARAIRHNTSMPVLSGMIIDVGESIKLSAFNYESMHQAVVGATIGEPGKVLVPGQAVASFLSALRGATVDIELDNNELTIASRASRARFPILNLEDYPTRPMVSEGQSAVVESADLVGAVASLGPLTSRDNDQGLWATSLRILGNTEPAGLKIYGGTRYAMGRTFIPCEVGSEFELLVPLRLLSDAVRDMSGLITLGHDAGNAYLSNGTRATVIRLYEADYPRVDYLFTMEAAFTTKIDKEALAGTLKLISTAGDQARLHLNGAELELTSRDSRNGEQGVVNDAIEVDGEGSRTLVASLKYLQPIVAGLSDEVLELDALKGRTVGVRDSKTHYVFQTLTPSEDSRV